MSFQTFYLQETFVNLFSVEEKSTIVDEAWDILQKAYSRIGGFKSAASKEELINDTFLWKAVKTKNEIVAVGIYKKKKGRKRIAIGALRTDAGKKGVLSIMKEDLKRAWVETSGPSEKTLKKFPNAEKYFIPNDQAAELTGKKILELNPDGYHYTRIIAGSPHEKMMIGTLNKQ